MTTKFVILCQPRTRSCLLQATLGRHPQILKHGEILNHRYQGGLPDAGYARLVTALNRNSHAAVGCRLHAFLADAIDSVLGQTVRPAEILVVDDASADRTVHVAQQYAGQGVRYLRVEHRCPYRTRRSGLEATESDAICFLDADDLLEEDYLESGLKGFADARVGIVYSDMQTFGGRLRRIVFPDAATDGDLFDEHFQTRNCIHSAALVRREALEMSGAFEFDLDRMSHEDWFVWRKVIEHGWQTHITSQNCCEARVLAQNCLIVLSAVAASKHPSETIET